MEKDTTLRDLTTGIIFLVIKSVILMFLWNFAVTDAFEGTNEISFLTALSIVLISKILFRNNYEIETKEDK